MLSSCPLQVAPGGEDMDVHAAAPLVGAQRLTRRSDRARARPGRLLELVQHAFDLCVGLTVLRRPHDHAGGVLVLELQHVGDGGDYVGFAGANLDALAELPGRVPLAEQ